MSTSKTMDIAMRFKEESFAKKKAEEILAAEKAEAEKKAKDAAKTSPCKDISEALASLSESYMQFHPGKEAFDAAFFDIIAESDKPNTLINEAHVVPVGEDSKKPAYLDYLVFQGEALIVKMDRYGFSRKSDNLFSGINVLIDSSARDEKFSLQNSLSCKRSTREACLEVAELAGEFLKWNSFIGYNKRMLKLACLLAKIEDGVILKKISPERARRPLELREVYGWEMIKFIYEKQADELLYTISLTNKAIVEKEEEWEEVSAKAKEEFEAISPLLEEIGLNCGISSPF